MAKGEGLENGEGQKRPKRTEGEKREKIGCLQEEKHWGEEKWRGWKPEGKGRRRKFAKTLEGGNSRRWGVCNKVERKGVQGEEKKRLDPEGKKVGRGIRKEAKEDERGQKEGKKKIGSLHEKH